MSTAETPASRDLLSADAYAQYLLSDPREIAFLLRQIAAQRTLLTIYYGNSGAQCLSSVIDAPSGANYAIFDLPRDPAIRNLLLAQDELICLTQLDRVKVQFPLNGPFVEVAHDGLPALRTAIPGTLLRLQRREFYRLVPPASDDLACQIPLEGGRLLEARVLDISGGGLAVMTQVDLDTFKPGAEFFNCQVRLPGFGVLTTRLTVRNLFRTTLRSGAEQLRVGCQFDPLSPAMSNAIQRYIMRAEQLRAANRTGNS